MNAIERLKRRVEHDYGFKIKKWSVIKKEKNTSFVVKIVTKEDRKYALKSLYMKPERQSFIAMSEQMLAERGVKLARPIPTLNGDLHMLHNHFPYVLYEWIDGENAKLRHQDDLESIIEAMARFHRASRELHYPSDVKIYAHPHWEKEYKERLKSLEKWADEHKASKNRKEAIIKRHLPFFRQMAKKALRALKSSSYDDYINEIPSAKSLVHGDLHNNNLIIRKNVKVLIDFEDVRYDLPSKDLLRIYSMYTKDHSFKGKAFISMMSTYEHYNSLSPEVKQLVFIDMLFPHIFERLLRKKKYVGMNSKELNHRIKQEKKKASYIYRHYFMKNGSKDRRNGLE